MLTAEYPPDFHNVCVLKASAPLLCPPQLVAAIRICAGKVLLAPLSQPPKLHWALHQHLRCVIVNQVEPAQQLRRHSRQMQQQRQQQR